MKRASVLCIIVCATASARAQTSPSPVTFFTGAELRRAIQTAPEAPGQTGLYVLRLSPPSESEVAGIRRTAPAKSEMHDSFTDVWYVIDGKATLVTGGKMQDVVVIAPGETRGSKITNGNSRQIKRGDYAVIPAGIPHWISRLEGNEILYFVVKVPVQTSPHQ